MNKIMEILFGKWVVERSEMCSAAYTVLGREFEQDILVVVERNSRSKKRRAYYKDIRDRKHRMSVGFLEAAGIV